MQKRFTLTKRLGLLIVLGGLAVAIRLFAQSSSLERLTQDERERLENGLDSTEYASVCFGTDSEG